MEENAAQTKGVIPDKDLFNRMVASTEKVEGMKEQSFIPPASGPRWALGKDVRMAHFRSFTGFTPYPLREDLARVFPAFLLPHPTFNDKYNQEGFDPSDETAGPTLSVPNGKKVAVYSMGTNYGTPYIPTGTQAPIFRINGKWWTDFREPPPWCDVQGAFAVGGVDQAGGGKVLTGGSMTQYTDSYSPVFTYNPSTGEITSHLAGYFVFFAYLHISVGVAASPNALVSASLRADAGSGYINGLASVSIFPPNNAPALTSMTVSSCGFVRNNFGSNNGNMKFRASASVTGTGTYGVTARFGICCQGVELKFGG